MLDRLGALLEGGSSASLSLSLFAQPLINCFQPWPSPQRDCSCIGRGVANRDLLYLALPKATELFLKTLTSARLGLATLFAIQLIH